VTNVVAPTDFGRRFSRHPSRDGLRALMECGLELPPKSDPSGLRSPPSFIGPGSDQLPFEFGKATKDGRH